jgi:Amt family ammonium transporter
MHFIPGLRLRVTDDSEIIGIDDAEMGEYAYDYVGLEPEIHPAGDLSMATRGGREPEHHHHDDDQETPVATMEKDGSTVTT